MGGGEDGGRGEVGLHGFLYTPVVALPLINADFLLQVEHLSLPLPPAQFQMSARELTTLFTADMLAVVMNKDYSTSASCSDL